MGQCDREMKRRLLLGTECAQIDMKIETLLQLHKHKFSHASRALCSILRVNAEGRFRCSSWVLRLGSLAPRKWGSSAGTYRRLTYDFEYEDDDDEQSGDVDIENKYYNAKQLKADDPEAAIDEFLGMPALEEEKSDW
ncbi:hypothetical protein IG631_06135 [Alternaria alternata]|nr:hypothetical protein IG631_06135 [Alternaria alternata]